MINANWVFMLDVGSERSRGPHGGINAAKALRDELFAPHGIEPILTLLSLPDGIHFDGVGGLIPWNDGLQ